MEKKPQLLEQLCVKQSNMCKAEKYQVGNGFWVRNVLLEWAER